VFFYKLVPCNQMILLIGRSFILLIFINRKHLLSSAIFFYDGIDTFNMVAYFSENDSGLVVPVGQRPHGGIQGWKDVLNLKGQHLRGAKYLLPTPVNSAAWSVTSGTRL
jgi:hypothetical protein